MATDHAKTDACLSRLTVRSFLRLQPCLLFGLVFSLLIPSPSAAPANAETNKPAQTPPPPFLIKADTKASLIRVGFAPMIVTDDSRLAAECVMDAIEKKDLARAQEAIKRYDVLIPKENLGGDYTAMQWICRDLIATAQGVKTNYDKLTTAYREFLVRDDYAMLKEYLLRQYALHNFKPTNTTEHKERRQMLEDYVMFMNPNREQWESSDKCLQLMSLKPGEKILDIGCGVGYYSYKMAQQVGPTGRIYAIDTNDKFTQFIDEFTKKENIRNIQTVVSEPTDIKVNDQADVAFICSLYHVIYGWVTEPNRRAFIESIKRSLKPDGRLVIVDNLPVDGRELHSWYIDRRLVASQFRFYGFREELYAELSPLRYILVLRRDSDPQKTVVQPLPDNIASIESNHELIRVTNANSIVHIGSLDSYDITPGGIAAAKSVIEALETKNPNAARKAIEQYNQLIPNENFGGEFTALQWFCEHLIATPEKQEAMLQDSLARAYYHYLADVNYAFLKDYVKFKYKLMKANEQSVLLDDSEAAPPTRSISDKTNATTQSSSTVTTTAAGDVMSARAKAVKPQDEATDPRVGKVRRAFIEDFILFNNPKRPEWEKTERILERLNFKPGDKIADIGCGSGYYTFRFAKMVGQQGQVFAMDIKEEHLAFMNEYMKKQGITNVTTIQSAEDDLRLKEPVDAAFMCSLYHIIYGAAPEYGRRAFIHSIKAALKPGGRFIIVDNGPVEDMTLPYHGPYIARELVIAQLEQYGFKFRAYHQIIPQRYLLEFELVRP